MIPIDIKDKVFGRLRVTEYDESSRGSGHARWFCQCLCGSYKSISAKHLITGDIVSCGCYVREISASPERSIKMSRIQMGYKNSNWKGDDVKYSTIHGWLSNNYKKSKCNHCKKEKKVLDWALKRGLRHARSRNNYLVLCRGCHIKYDRQRI